MSSQITTTQALSYYSNVSTDKHLEWALCNVIERTCLIHHQGKIEIGGILLSQEWRITVPKWCDTHQVTVLTTIDDAIEVAWKHDCHGNVQFKPKAFVEYTSNMWGSDLLDQLITSYCIFRRSVKWWRKLFFHMFSLLLNNACVLHKKYGVKPVAHDVFLEHIVQNLLNESMGNATTKVIRKRPAEMSTSCQFEGDHYPVHIPKGSGSKIGGKKCAACNFGKRN